MEPLTDIEVTRCARCASRSGAQTLGRRERRAHECDVVVRAALGCYSTIAIYRILDLKKLHGLVVKMRWLVTLRTL